MDLFPRYRSKKEPSEKCVLSHFKPRSKLNLEDNNGDRVQSDPGF
jgi:hypothetical protein